MTELASRYEPHEAARKWSAKWEENRLFVGNPDSKAPPFTIVIPPPNVTGQLHMGHALNNTLQDVLVRYKRMDGYNALWIPGTDHAGIATQWVVKRNLEAQGIDYRDLGREPFVEKIWEWKAEKGGRIVEQLKRLGVSADWTRERFTLDPMLAKAVTEHFVRLYEEGLIYRGQRLINWDPIDQTALSDLEVIHQDAMGEMWSFAYALADGSGEIVVSTTRPETMLGDTAVAVHPDDPRYTALVGKMLLHPFFDRQIPIIADTMVDPAFGTGAVKLTPAHDPNDFAAGERHKLAMINIMNPDGSMNAAAGAFEGLSAQDARKAVKERIEAQGFFRGRQDHAMSIGYSQRSGAVVEPLLSTQWFVHMKPLAGPALAAVENGFTNFVPRQWENTYYSWLKDIKDWCISRQLWWGHRIPAWYCDACGHVHVAREEPTLCSACGHTHLSQDSDVLDTWFSSALWPFSTMGWPDKTPDFKAFYPTSVLVTAFDIIFFWVARMMFAGIHLTGQVPFKDVYIHALIRDKDGQKMSKTKGNVVDPLEVIDQWGADAFRFTLLAFAAQGRDVLWDEKRVEGYSRFTTKIWQALRFAFLHEYGYDPKAEMDFGPYEAWIQARTGAAVARVRDALDTYRFNDAAAEIYQFTWGEYCDWYIELSKNALYSEATTPARRNAVKHTLFETMGAIVRMLHPMMPFLTEEIWEALPGTEGFVAVAPFPKASDYLENSAVLEEVALVQEVITAVRGIRGEMELGRKVDLTALVADPVMLHALSAHAGALLDLAGLKVGLLEQRPAGAATAVIRGHELVLPLDGVVDFAEEVKRLDKVIAKGAKDVEQLAGRLSNPTFADRAPVEVVEEVKGKLEAAQLRLSTLRASRTRLAEALA